MRATVFAGMAVVAACGGALHAQQPPTPVSPAATVQAPDTEQAPDQQRPAAGATPKQSPDSRRDDIRMMESVLTQALQKGAQDLARMLRVNQPNSAFVTGTGRARGIILDGYGILFDVDVPGMRQSVVWSEQMVQLMQDRERTVQALAGMRSDDPLRKVAEMQYRTIERLIEAAKGGQVLIPNPTAPTQLLPQPQPGMVAPQAVTSEVAVTSAPVALPDGRALVTSTPAALSPSAVARDPNELYTESVKNALIDAMLKYSAFLKLGDAEWLTVAAGDSEGPPVPGQLDDTSRIVIRIKGADLTAFQAGKLTREEVLKKVEVREY